MGVHGAGVHEVSEPRAGFIPSMASEGGPQGFRGGGKVAIFVPFFIFPDRAETIISRDGMPESKARINGPVKLVLS